MSVKCQSRPTHRSMINAKKDRQCGGPSLVPFHQREGQNLIMSVVVSVVLSAITGAFTKSHVTYCSM